MVATLSFKAARPLSRRAIGWGLLFSSMAVIAQTASDRLEANPSFDDVTINRIQEDAALWRQMPEEEASTEPQWRAAEPPKAKQSGRVTWGYDSTYEDLRDRRYDQSGSPSFDFSEERSGTLFRYNF